MFDIRSVFAYLALRYTPICDILGVTVDIRSISALVTAFTLAIHDVDVAAQLQRAAASSH